MFDQTRRSRFSYLTSLTMIWLFAHACGEERQPTQPDPLAIASVIVSPAADTIVALGASTQLSAEATDESGDAMSGQTFEWTSSDETIATVDQTGLVVALAEGMTIIEASVAGISGAAKITVQQRPAALVFVEQPSDAEAGKPISPEVRIELRDAEGHVVADGTDSVSLTLGAGPGAAVLLGRTTVAPAGGVAIFNDLSIELAGVDYTLMANAAGAAGESIPFSVAAGPSAALAFLEQPTTGELNLAMATIRVAHTDAFGNLAPTDRNPISVKLDTNPSNSLLSGTTLMTPTNGVAEFSDLVIDQPGSGYTLRATSVDADRSSDAFDVRRTFIDISAGALHTCGVTASGDVFCWGTNVAGQVGTKRTNDSVTAPGRLGDGRTYTAVSAGRAHTCGVVVSGKAFCWGRGIEGQLGNARSDPKTVAPVEVHGGNGFASLSAGGFHTCGVTQKSEALCWGDNRAGQIGRPLTTLSSLIPRPVTDASAPTALTAGSSHSCMLGKAMSVFCWGDNQSSQLGDGTSVPTRFEARPVAGGLAYASLSSEGGMHTCALTRDNIAYCWGKNHRGQIGIGVTSDSVPKPQVVATSLQFQSISVGFKHTCALTSAGEAYCWGANDEFQLGDGTDIERTTPRPVATSILFVAIDAGGEHTCGISVDGEVYCWGENGDGQLGDGSGVSTRETPVRIAR